jgi:hypothetical protein
MSVRTVRVKRLSEIGQTASHAAPASHITGHSGHVSSDSQVAGQSSTLIERDVRTVPLAQFER